MTTTFFLLQDIYSSLELLVRLNLTWVAKYHTTLDFILIDTTEKQTYVITSLTFIEKLAEHFHTSYSRLLIFTKTEQFNFVTYVDNTSFDTTSSNSTTTSDREYVFDRHQEWLICSTRRLLNPLINSVHEFHNLISPFFNTVQSTECRTADNWSIFLIFVLCEDFAELHFYEFEHFLIFNHITLVQEYNQARYVYLTSEQYVLTCLRHRTVCSGTNQDSTVHLSSTSNHVLYIVGVTRTVYVCIVTLCCFVLNV